MLGAVVSGYPSPFSLVTVFNRGEVISCKGSTAIRIAGHVDIFMRVKRDSIGSVGAVGVAVEALNPFSLALFIIFDCGANRLL